MMMKGDLTWDGGHTIPYIDGVSQNYTPETYIVY